MIIKVILIKFNIQRIFIEFNYLLFILFIKEIHSFEMIFYLLLHV